MRVSASETEACPDYRNGHLSPILWGCDAAVAATYVNYSFAGHCSALFVQYTKRKKYVQPASTGRPTSSPQCHRACQGRRCPSAVNQTESKCGWSWRRNQLHTIASKSSGALCGQFLAQPVHRACMQTVAGSTSTDRTARTLGRNTPPRRPRMGCIWQPLEVAWTNPEGTRCSLRTARSREGIPNPRTLASLLLGAL